MHSSELHAPEWTVRSRFFICLTDAGLEEAHNTICTTNGEILHNHHYNHTLEPGKCWLDGGAESPYGYRGPMTRTALFCYLQCTTACRLFCCVVRSKDCD